MSTSEKYPGQNILISYLKKKGSKSSYNSFLDIIIYHKDVFTTLSSAETCDDLNNTWFFHFLKEAESLLDQDAFLIVYAENLRYEKKWQIFWQEQKKENLVPAITESTESNIVIPAATESSRPENESAKQKEKKRTRDTNDTYTDDLSSTEHWKKQCQIIEQNKDNLMYKQSIDNILSVVSAHESLIAGNIIPFIKVLKTRLLARSQMSLSSANESVLQAIIENILPLNCYIPELSLVIDGKKSKGSGRFGYSDIFILGDNNVSLELKYISLVGLIKNKVGANELENLDKIIEKENEKVLLKRPYTFWLKGQKKINQTTIEEVLDNGINQLILYMNIISKGKVANYSSSGVFDKRVRITKSNSNPSKLIGFVILVIGFRRILWKPVDEVMSNYIYDKV
ncbi:hypothetical protein RclHR1_04940004 [Rhizophagus clarus]|uniref:Uncharacterized protein n=1 Tax=Rhizophagus clarus TaxID=94130 RepID=A0A2Z6RL21_9GLOM|nr:hypothetical protein RclHR1_04940004 [Rhizophagus clarus]